MSAKSPVLFVGPSINCESTSAVNAQRKLVPYRTGAARRLLLPGRCARIVVSIGRARGQRKNTPAPPHKRTQKKAKQPW